MLTLALGVSLFVGIVLMLSAVLLAARAKLQPGGDISIEVNHEDEQRLSGPAGDTLLNALTANRIFLPSACGGKGTCGVCRVKVEAGGGALLPTESAHVNPQQAREGVRLACQLKLREDISIELPPEVFGVRKWTCRVRSNENVATFIKELVLELPEGEAVPFRAGGYIQIECPPHHVRFSDFDIAERFRPAWTGAGLFELESRVDEPVVRAYSMANYPDESDIIMLNVRIATPPSGEVPPGKMSSYIFNLQPGDEVVISGPYGEFFAKETDREMVFIGGGAGMAPMRSHIFDQFRRLHTERKVSFWYGARSLSEAFYVPDLDSIEHAHDNFEWHLALSEPQPEDEWTGPTGFIHQVVHDMYLSKHQDPEEIEYYLCGPPMMIDACWRMLADLGVEPEQVMYDEF